MAEDTRLFVGTVGEGLYVSDDGGGTFKRRAGNGLYIEGEVRALAAHPRNPRRIYAGTNAGVCRSDDGGDTWQRLPSAMDDMVVWALLVLPGAPDTIFAGTRPAGVFRSTDGGDTWHDAQLGAQVECAVIEYNRITTIIADPIAPRCVWVGVEIDGCWRSNDAGDTWSRHADGLSSLDVHGLVVVPENGSRRLVAATNNGVNVSADEGASWQRQELGAVTSWNYFRGIRQHAGQPETLFLGNGDGPPGFAGAALRSRDGTILFRKETDDLDVAISDPPCFKTCKCGQRFCGPRPAQRLLHGRGRRAALHRNRISGASEPSSST